MKLTMAYEIHHGCCDTCKHYRRVTGLSKDGIPIEEGYCHATRNYAKKQPTDNCKRWSADPKSVTR